MSYTQLLGTNPRLALIFFFGANGILGILPFAIWRLWQGQWLLGAIELVLVAGIAAAVWVSWKLERAVEASHVAVVLISAGCMALVLLIGPTAIYWSFAVLVANLLLANRQFGLLANLVLIGTLSVGALHDDVFAGTTYVIAALLVTAYAYHFAIMTDLQREKLAALATFDELTGAGNRRMMESDFAELVARGMKPGREHAIALLDLDHFKQVNDTHGHEAGDIVLKDVVNLIQRFMRRDDRLYRLGGEEFVLLLPDVGAEKMVAALERLLEFLRPRLACPGGPVTTSVGAALMSSSDPSWKDALARADQALYRAKEEGRDRFRIYDARVPDPRRGFGTGSNSAAMVASETTPKARIRRRRAR